MYNIESNFSDACLIHTGSKRKQMRFLDEIEWMNRRSSRIIALEEKRHKEIERKLALALERKNNLVNHYKEKGKATMKVPDDLSDFSKDVEGPTKKGHKSKELYQLISSIKGVPPYFILILNILILHNKNIINVSF